MPLSLSLNSRQSPPDDLYGNFPAANSNGNSQYDSATNTQTFPGDTHLADKTLNRNIACRGRLFLQRCVVKGDVVAAPASDINAESAQKYLVALVASTVTGKVAGRDGVYLDSQSEVTGDVTSSNGNVVHNGDLVINREIKVGDNGSPGNYIVNGKLTSSGGISFGGGS